MITLAENLEKLAKLKALRANLAIAPYSEQIISMYLKEHLGAKSIGRRLYFKVSRLRIVSYLKQAGIYQPSWNTHPSQRLKEEAKKKLPEKLLAEEFKKDMRELETANQRVSWSKHPEAIKFKARKAYHEKYAKDPEYVENQRATSKRIYRKNTAKKLEQNKKWREENPERVKELKKKSNRSEQAKAYQKEYRKRPAQKIVRNLKDRFKDITGKNGPKLPDFIGCNTEFLKSYLETQFKRGMKWSNYGSYWFVRIVKPCASFDLSNPKQIAICFNWQNIRPEKVHQKCQKGVRRL